MQGNADRAAPVNPFDLEFLADDERWSDLAGEDDEDEEMTTPKVGSIVRHIDGAQTGTITRIIGQKRVGGGLHARVAWNNGGSSVVRLDLLVPLIDGT